MKKITLLLAFCVFTVLAMAYPQTLPIDYTQFFATTAMGTDPILELGQYTSTSAAIMPNQWNRSGKSGDQGGSSPTVEANSLSYSTYVDNNNGKAIVLTALGAGLLHSSPYSLTSTSSDYTDKPFYLGMLVNLSTVTSSGGVDFFAFDSNYTGNAQRGRIFVKTSGAGFSMGIGWDGTSTVATWSGELVFGTTYFIVAKVTPLSVSANESIALYINPTIGATEAASPATSTKTDCAWGLKTIKALTIRQRPEFAGKLAGLRFSDNWADVVKASTSGLTQLTAPVVGVASLITSDGFTANWTSVANAVGYDVKVYLGANLISTTNATGQATSSVAVTGLMSGLTYTYKVIANGNGTTNSDSDPSSASAAFTTLGTVATINTDFSDLSWGTPDATARTSGAYLSSFVNGFNLQSAYLLEGSENDLKGLKHTNRIHVDKLSNNGMVTLPTVNSLEQIEIHLSMGSGDKDFNLKEFDAVNNSWVNVGTYMYNSTSKTEGTDSVYIIPISRSTPTILRLENNTTSSMYLWQVITRTTNPSSLAIPIVGTTSGISSTGFIANWTAVANATAYNVYVYQAGSEVIGSPFNVSGQATVSLAITGLTAETAYTYNIQAVGDGGTSYLDSFMSPSSSVTTSTATSLETSKSSVYVTVSGKRIIASESGNIEVYNLQGAQVLRAKNVKSINTNLVTGMYIVNFVNNAGAKTIQKISIR